MCLKPHAMRDHTHKPNSLTISNLCFPILNEHSFNGKYIDMAKLTFTDSVSKSLIFLKLQLISWVRNLLSDKKKSDKN